MRRKLSDPGPRPLGRPGPRRPDPRQQPHPATGTSDPQQTGLEEPGAEKERPVMARPAASETTGAHIVLRDVPLGRPGAAVLAGVSVDVPPGQILTVVGPSGCGKSTLLRTLAGLLPPLAGEITVDGDPVRGPGADRALVFQEDATLPWRTLRANVELPLAIAGTSRGERRTRAAHWLSRVGLDGLGRRLPHQVSGGQRQRAQLARALAGAPRAVLMDEPFGALDARTRAGMQDLLVDVWRDTGASVVFVTHDVDEALFLGDRVALLDTGRLTTVHDVPHPRVRAAVDDPATTELRRTVLAALGAHTRQK